MNTWSIRSKKLLHDLKFFQVHGYECVHPDKKATEYFVINTRDWVNVIPVTKDGRAVMIRQFRAGAESLTLEFPGGIIDAADPEPAHGGARELREETGYEPRTVVALGKINPNPAIMGNLCHFVLALDCEKTADQELDENEDVDVVLVKLSDLPDLIARGEINHALMLAALQLLCAARPDLRKLIYGD